MCSILPIAVAGIVKNNQVLLLLRKKEPYKDLWSLPGGKINSEEFASETIVREIKEETSINAYNNKYMGTIFEKIYIKGQIYRNHIISVFIHQTQTIDINDSDEGTLKWFSINEINESKDTIIPTDFMIISKIIIGRHMGSYNCTVELDNNRYILKNFLKI